MSMTFESVLESLNKRDVLLDDLGQIEDGKKWSARVRKKGTTKIGYGQGKTIETSVKAALANMRDSMNPNEWKKIVATVNPMDPKKRKRTRLRAKR